MCRPFREWSNDQAVVWYNCDAGIDGKGRKERNDVYNPRGGRKQ